MSGVSTQVCNFHFGGPQFRLSTCTLKMKMVTLSWDSICNLPTMVYMWSIWVHCLLLWIWFTLLFPKEKSSQPWTPSSWLFFCPRSNRAFPFTNITTVLYWNGPTWKCPKRSGWMGICRQKHLPGKSQAGQTNILTPVKSRLSWKHSVRWIARAKE